MTLTSTDTQDFPVLGIKVKDLSWGNAFAFSLSCLNDDFEQHIFAFLNANNANISIKDDVYRDALSRAKVLPDGFGIDIASKITRGKMFSANLNGTDFVPSLLVYAQEPLTVALVGSQGDIPDKAAQIFYEKTPWHKFVVISDGYFGPQGTQSVLDDLSALKPDVLLVGMGSPIQEKWVDQHIKPEHGKMVFTVGALFDFVSNDMPRAPERWRRLRIEWVYRLVNEPRRLWRRYIIGNPLFIWHVVRQKFFNKTKDTRISRI